tara:strand:+ start:538 stop:843 length:306 start_codon:yes stop_codon:yes gene_type:complete
MESSNSYPIYEGDDYKARLEYNREYMIVHLPEVYKFNRDILAKLAIKLEDLKEFSANLGYPELYAAAPKEDTKINKLARRIGFTLLGEAEGLMVYYYTGDT